MFCPVPSAIHPVLFTDWLRCLHKGKNKKTKTNISLTPPCKPLQCRTTLKTINLEFKFLGCSWVFLEHQTLPKKRPFWHFAWYFMSSLPILPHLYLRWFFSSILPVVSWPNGTLLFLSAFTCATSKKWNFLHSLFWTESQTCWLIRIVTEEPEWKKNKLYTPTLHYRRGAQKKSRRSNDLCGPAYISTAETHAEEKDEIKWETSRKFPFFNL